MKAISSRKRAVLLAATLLALGADAQQQRHQSKIFTAPDGAFLFSYPANFQICTKGKTQSCDSSSYIPVCDDNPIACVVYPSELFKGTNFESAGFQVREILNKYGSPPSSADHCVTPNDYEQPEDFLLSAEHPTEVIGGVTFVHGISGGAACGHSSSRELYRTFHKGRCFELSTNTSATSPNISDPPMKTLTSAQQKRLEDTMSDILHSFRFAK